MPTFWRKFLLLFFDSLQKLKKKRMFLACRGKKVKIAKKSLKRHSIDKAR